MRAIDHADFSLGAFFHRLPEFLSPPFQCSWPLIFDSACLSDGRSGPCEVSFPLSPWLQPAPLSCTPQSLIDGYAPPRLSHPCFSTENQGQTFSTLAVLAGGREWISAPFYPQTTTAGRIAPSRRHKAVHHGCTDAETLLEGAST